MKLSWGTPESLCCDTSEERKEMQENKEDLGMEVASSKYKLFFPDSKKNIVCLGYFLVICS